jgi:glycosyltransferase involved in cell wall biosynthesis
MTEPVFVSIIVPTCNRPVLLSRGLERIRDQSYARFECIVVDDGSNDKTISMYPTIKKRLDDRFFFLYRDKDDKTGGTPGRSRNRGIEFAHGRFLAFCDDDDFWIRDDHLEIAVSSLLQFNADLFFANIRFSISEKLSQSGWYSPLERLMQKTPLAPDRQLFELTRGDMSKLLMHRHIPADTLVLESRLLTEAGLYWDQANIAEDLELTLRLADKARRVIYRSTVVAVADVSEHPSVIRRCNEVDSALWGIVACLHAESLIEDPALRRAARSQRAWRLLDLAEMALRAGHRQQSLELASQALLLRMSLRSIRMIGRAFLLRNRLFKE